MNRSLDRAMAEVVASMPTLRAAVLSAAPDGLITWCWSREPEPDIALGFARLDRAATICLEALGAPREARSMMLTAKNTWVVAWPLDDGVDGANGGDRVDDVDETQAPAGRLVLTVVFAGELQPGMVMVNGRRVLTQLRTAFEEVRSARCDALRDRIVELLLGSSEPVAVLEQLAAEVEIEPRQLERLEALDDELKGRIEAAAKHQLVRLRVASA